MASTEASTEDRALHRRLTINTISNFGRYVLSIAVAFFLTPFIVRTLGDAVYGFWVLVMSFIGYASILEMGVQPAVVKLVGQYRGLDDTAKLNELITAAFTFFITVGLISMIGCVTIIPGVVQGHVEGLENLDPSGWLFAVIALDAAVMFLKYLYSATLYGWQRYHLQNILDVAGWLLNALLIVLFLERGGVLALAIVKLSVDVVGTTASYFMVRSVFPQLRMDLRALSRSSFRELMSFGGRIFMSSTANRVATNAQPIIISTALTAAATAFYAIPVRLIDYARQIGWSLGMAFMPAFSELQSRQEAGLMRSIYLSYSRYIFLVQLPILVLLFVYGVPFIGLWIGPEYAQQGRWTLYFLTASVLAASLQPLLWRLFIGVGRLNDLVKASASSPVSHPSSSTVQGFPTFCLSCLRALPSPSAPALAIALMFFGRSPLRSLNPPCTPIPWRQRPARMASPVRRLTSE